MSHADVIVIGAGLAGASTAFSLARRGAHVLLLESESGICERASGNRFGLLTPYIATRASPLLELYSAGYTWTLDLLKSPFAANSGFSPCGAIQFASTKRFETLLSESLPTLGARDITRAAANECSELAGIPCDQGGFVVPSSGFVSPARFMKELITRVDGAITTCYSTRVTSLNFRDGRWSVGCVDTSMFEASNVIVCGAFESNILPPSSWLPLEPIRGQTVSVSASPVSSRLRMVLCFGGYLTPAVEGEHLLGAHYRHDDDNQEPSAEDTQEIVKGVTRALPSLSLSTSLVRSSRVCFRTSTIDRMPYIGQLPNFDAMKKEALSFRSGSNIRERVKTLNYGGLYVNVGHGSRGLLTGPLGGEIIARLINKESLGSLHAAATLCDPDRVPHRLIATSRQ
jgi:tRNA 5-methylaminomethyl-2-thiouridine biosynthesis bifunctional protein